MDISIGLISCFFGELPWYFNYFVHSCSYNKHIDFYIVTDDKKRERKVPPNIHFIYQSLDEMAQMASHKLGLEANISFGYKLCDFKPAYGIIFSHLLQGYDFWGHTDIDIIFGDIREFISNQLLNEFDLISVRPDWLTGCFLIYRNDQKINNLFRHSKVYKKVLTSTQHYCFDETNFAHDAFSDGKNYLEIETEIESMMHVVKKMEAQGLVKPYFDLHIVEGLPGWLRFEKGKMYYRNKYSILLYHMIHFKKINKSSNTKYIGESFNISPKKIYIGKRAKKIVNGL